MNKVVFLDIDGPMIPATMILVDRMASPHRKFPATTVAVINTLCERTGAKIVFNTTHNNSWEGVEDIEVALVNQGLKEIHIHPTDNKTKYPQLERGKSVEDWLSRHPEVTDWIAIDDSRFTDDERLIWIDPDAGVHLGHLNEAIQRLGGRQVLIFM